MGFAFFARYSFKIIHICRLNWCADYGQMINLSDFISSLVVFEEKHQVLHVLKFDKC